MRKLKRCLVGLLCALSLPLFAGSRGYNLAFMDVSATAFADGKPALLSLRQTKAAQQASCWACEYNQETGIAVLFINRLPPGLTTPLARQAIEGNATALRTLQSIARTFRDADGTQLDGILIYAHHADTVTVYAISPQAGSPRLQQSIKVATQLPPSALDSLLKRLVLRLPFTP